MTSALMIAAPSSGSGKTIITLALLRALRNLGHNITSAKAGPDYIDPAFHEIACGKTSVNLDPWAMSGSRIHSLAQSQDGDLLLIEAMMGLYDGAVDGSASAASLACQLGASVLLVVDATKQSHSIAALVRGFRDHAPHLNFSGVILNKVGSPRHEAMLRAALQTIDVEVLGAVYRNEALVLPERHLGLVQAGEIEGVETFIQNASKMIESACDLEAISGKFHKLDISAGQAQKLPPLGQRIAIARDEAFAFCYPHLLRDWRDNGAEITFFSPLQDEVPSEDADAIYLPGGYPELHLECLAAANQFKQAMQNAKKKNCIIYGECGGYMVMGNGIVDKAGKTYGMCELLKLETSFENRKLHLGYRKLTARDFIFGDQLMAHEFHYTSAIREDGIPLFSAKDALDVELGHQGLRDGNVMGSYAHIIDRCSHE